MSQNHNALDKISKDVSDMHIFDNKVSGHYNGLFYDHLTLLIKPKLLSDLNDVDTLVLNSKSYLGLEQYTLENSSVVESNEPFEIDWDFVEEAKEIFRSKVVASLKKEGRSEYFNPLIKFSSDLFENYHIYDQLYPMSTFNPWYPAYKILENGFMVMLSDNRDVLDSYNKGVYKTGIDDEDISKLGLLAKSAKNNTVRGFMVDKRYSTQSLVFDFLRREAAGSSFAKSIREISEFVQIQGRLQTYENIKNKVLLPLKRAGLVGSSSNGFYYLVSKQDFIDTYTSHRSKIRAIERTLVMYEERYKLLDHGNLKDDSE